MTPEPVTPLRIFCSYAHKDETLRDELDLYLVGLRRNLRVVDWYDRHISPGAEWAEEINEQINKADIILLLVSQDFIASEFCHGIEMEIAMRRQQEGTAHVLPVLLRPCTWEDEPFGKLQVLPTDAVAVTKWANRDDAFVDVARGITKVVKALLAKGRGGGVTAAPAGSAPAESQYLPRPLAIGFVPRYDRDGRPILDRLKEVLAPQSHHQVALWGPGGVGKTTLAAEAARALGEAYAQRVVWVSAYGREDFNLSMLLDDIATQLGRPDLRRLSLREKEEEVRALITAAPLLVVLDNLETVTPEEADRCTGFLARRAPCTTLITSRQPVEGAAHNIQIDALSDSEAREFLGRLLATTQSAGAFAGLDRETIIRSAGANPQVLQWVVKLIELTGKPQAVLGDLMRVEGGVARRVFDLTFDLPQLRDGRAVLLALSLFVPGASRDALAEVAGFGDDLKRLNDAVRRLAEFGLVRVTDGGQRLMAEGLTRELIRERMSKEESADEYRRRFVAYFLRYAEEHERSTFDELDLLEVEKDNILGAMEVAFSQLRAWGSVVGLAEAVGRVPDGFLEIRGYWDEAIRRGEQAVAAARELEDEQAATKFSISIATVRMKRGEYDEARRVLQQALGAHGVSENDLAAFAQHLLGIIALNQGDLVEARRGFEGALHIRRKINDQLGVAVTLHEMGRLARNQGNFNEAHRLYTQSLEIRRSLDDQIGIAFTLHELGRLAHDQEDLKEAARLYEESLAVNRRVGNRSGIAITLHEMGRLAQAGRDYAKARECYQASLDINQGQLNDQSGVANTLNELGKLTIEEGGDLSGAQNFCQQSLRIRRKLRDQAGIAGCWYHLGMVAEKRGDRTEAESLYRDSLVIFESLKSPYAEMVWRSLDGVQEEPPRQDGPKP